MRISAVSGRAVGPDTQHFYSVLCGVVSVCTGDAHSCPLIPTQPPALDAARDCGLTHVVKEEM